MKRAAYVAGLLAAIVLVGARYAGAGQVSGAASDPDVPISHRHRVYAAEQFCNTVSVTDPADNKPLGSTWRSAPRQFQSALSRPIAGAWPWDSRPTIAPWPWSRLARMPFLH
jgi:hypothetical protein